MYPRFFTWKNQESINQNDVIRFSLQSDNRIFFQTRNESNPLQWRFSNQDDRDKAWHYLTTDPVDQFIHQSMDMLRYGFEKFKQLQEKPAKSARFSSPINGFSLHDLELFRENLHPAVNHHFFESNTEELEYPDDSKEFVKDLAYKLLRPDEDFSPDEMLMAYKLWNECKIAHVGEKAGFIFARMRTLILEKTNPPDSN